MSDEVRTSSRTGGEKGMKAQRYDLLPKAALDAIGEVFAFGANKYKSHNWRLGYEWSKSYAAAMRHMTAHWDGETSDAESGLPHLAHAGCHLMFMLTWLAEQGEGGEFDDRYAPQATDDRDEKFKPFDIVGDLRPFQDSINKAFGDLLDATELHVEWRDPAPRTTEETRNALEILRNIKPAQR